MCIYIFPTTRFTAFAGLLIASRTEMPKCLLSAAFPVRNGCGEFIHLSTNGRPFSRFTSFWRLTESPSFIPVFLRGRLADNSWLFHMQILVYKTTFTFWWWGIPCLCSWGEKSRPQISSNLKKNSRIKLFGMEGRPCIVTHNWLINYYLKSIG